MKVDFIEIIGKAWSNYGDTRLIVSITDISVQVSTNSVYQVKLDDGNILFAKLSYFGRHGSFSNDHKIIYVLANNLGLPFDGFLARSLVKGNKLYIYRYRDIDIDASIVFYLPVKINHQPPKRLNIYQIANLGKEIAGFHKACDQVRKTLPKPGKTVVDDMRNLNRDLDGGNKYFVKHESLIREHIEKFLVNSSFLRYDQFNKIPVFLDWNIGNFSVNHDSTLCSRWDYDWFRVDSRIMDFYFLSRVVSDIGDKTSFSYVFTTLMEDRFFLFLQNYHEVFPLTENEIHFMKEMYRFFILNYVIREGRRFFHTNYIAKLQSEAFEYMPRLDEEFQAERILKALKI